VHYYLTTNVSRNEPEGIRAYSYIHVKAKVDGSQTIIISDEDIVIDGVAKLSKADAQVVLDGWIDAENVAPEKDVDGIDLIQARINLDIYEF
jgi:hypothetical protein